MTEDHIDIAQKYIDDTLRLGQQLQSARENQQVVLARMVSLKESGQTDSQEYAELQQRSHQLDALISRFTPIYEERTALLREVEANAKRRRKQR